MRPAAARATSAIASPIRRALSAVSFNSESSATRPTVEAAFERAIDAHVEPALDRAAEELHRYRIHEHAGQHRNQRKQQHEPRGEP